MSGAVGTYAHIPPHVEEHVCTELGLEPEPAATQVVARDRHAEFLSTLALVGASLERFATEIRHLQRSEVGEAREPFRSGQKGSSAMPHKRNPIVSERMAGLARLLRGYAQVGLGERRPVARAGHLPFVGRAGCHPRRLPGTGLRPRHLYQDGRAPRDRRGADGRQPGSDQGLVYSQSVLLTLVATGWSRDDAYRLVQSNALRAWDERRHLAELLAEDPEMDLSSEQLAACFNRSRCWSIQR